MKIKLIVTAACLASGAALHAATAQRRHGRAEPARSPRRPVIAVLPAGSEQPTAVRQGRAAPRGLDRRRRRRPIRGLRQEQGPDEAAGRHAGRDGLSWPRRTARGVLTVFEKGDKAEITGLRGGWTQVRLEKPLVGYIQTEPPSAPAPRFGPRAVGRPLRRPRRPRLPPPPRPAATSSESLSRIFEGTLASTKTLLYPKRPYDWQLNDPSGKRIAYVDLNKLLLTDQIENYAGHGVMVLGALKQADDPKDIVIVAEALRLK